jgi:hypothetical protein
MHACRALACTETKPIPATTTTALSDITNRSQASVASVNPSGPNVPFPWGFNVPNFTFINCSITMYNGSVTQRSKYALNQEQLNNFAEYD